VNEKDSFNSENLMQSSEIEKFTQHWISTSDEDFATMLDMYKTKHYHWTLFLGHLVIEKLLKACFVKKKHQFPPLIHNLLRLAEKAEIEINENNLEFLATVTTFNINARYDDYKQTFYQLCTKEFTDIWFEKIKNYRQWIKQKYLT
jgi:HEPN domain-containing protein